MTELNEGQLTFKVEGGEHDGVELIIDVVMAKLAAEPVERAHGVGKGWQPTPKFCADVAQAFMENGIVDSCTPSMAYHIYFTVVEAWLKAKKNMSFLQNLQSSTVEELLPPVGEND